MLPTRTSDSVMKRIELQEETGQAGVEYAVITAAIMGGLVMGWPFMVQLMNALNTYYHSLYYVIGAPL